MLRGCHSAHSPVSSLGPQENWNNMQISEFPGSQPAAIQGERMEEPRSQQNNVLNHEESVWMTWPRLSNWPQDNGRENVIIKVIFFELLFLDGWIERVSTYTGKELFLLQHDASGTIKFWTRRELNGECNWHVGQAKWMGGSEFIGQKLNDLRHTIRTDFYSQLQITS